VTRCVPALGPRLSEELHPHSAQAISDSDTA